MRFRSSSSAAIVASLMAHDVLAALHHRGHQAYHAKRDVIVTEDVVETIIVTDYVTIDWPPASSIDTTSTISTTSTVSTTSTISTKSSTRAPSSPAAKVVPAAPATTLATIASIPAASVAATPVATHPVAAAAVPASKPAAAPAAAADTSSSGNKRGAAYNDASLVSAFSGSKVSWAYNWGPNSAGLTGDFEYVPMLWGLGDHTTGWSDAASAAIASGSSHILSFNEPDLGAQSNIDAGTAAAGYLQFIQPFAGKASLGAPAVTNGAAPLGLDYLSRFISACSGCTIDFVTIHWYDSAQNAAYFKQHVADAYAAGGNRPVWITEFGAAGSNDEQNAFLQEVIPWLDSQAYVQRYAYFMASDGVLLAGNSLSELGQTFASYA